MSRAVALCLLVASGCGEDSRARPPIFEGDAVEDPKSCGELRGQGESTGSGALVIDGKAARCVGEGSRCALSDVSTFASACDVGETAEASCQGTNWILQCLAPEDAG